MSLEGTARHVFIASRDWLSEDETILTGADWSTTLPLPNVIDDKLSKVARSINAGSPSTALTPFIEADINVPFPVTLIAIPKHTFSGEATWRIRAAEAVVTTTSASSVAVGTGSKTFTVASGLNIQAGNSVFFRRATDATIWLAGYVVSYIGTTLIVYIRHIGGSGTISNWSVNVVDWNNLATQLYDSRPVLAQTASTTSLSYSMGTKTLVVDENVGFYNGYRTRLENGADYMEGDVVDYNGVSGELIVNIDSYSGTGSAASWTVKRLSSDIRVWPEIKAFGDGYWGEFDWGGRLTLGEKYNPPAVHYIPLVRDDPDPISARFWRIDFDDSNNPDDYIDIARLLLSPAYQPTEDIPYEWKIEFVDPSQRSRSRGGQFYVDARPKYRRISVTITHIPRDEMFSNLYELDRVNGVARPVFICVDPTDSANIHRLAAWGSAPNTTPITQIGPDLYAKEVVVEEWL